MSRAYRLALLTLLCVLLADQGSKGLMTKLLTGGEPLRVTPFLNLVLVWNPGISFGLLADVPARWPIIVLSLTLCALLLWWNKTHHRRGQALATGMICGGALGNVIDRLHYGAVVDFIDIHAYGYHWPAFNLADSAIVVGVALLLFHEWFNGRLH